MIRHLPNLLSALRLTAAPIASYLILNGDDVTALLIFALAGASDGLDGYIARRWEVSSAFGAWLDPAADKLLMLLCFMALFVVGMTPLWLVALVVVRDLAIAAGWLMIKLFHLPVATAPLFIGKASTLVQYLFVFATILLLAFGLDAPRLLEAAGWVCALFTILSAAAYGGVFLRGFFAGSRIA